MKNDLIAGTLGTALSATGTVLQTNDILQTISLIITIIGGIITFIVIPLLTWLRKAKSDGKITKDEISEGVDTLQKGLDEVENLVDDKKKGK